MSEAPRPIRVHPNRIEITLRDLSQRCNSMAPSPLHAKALDDDAVEFILGWAQEFPLAEPVFHVIELPQRPATGAPRELIATAIHHYFADRAKRNSLAFKRLLEQGRTSLAIGLDCLAGYLLSSKLLIHVQSSTGAKIIRESLPIGGSVARWRPMPV